MKTNAQSGGALANHLAESLREARRNYRRRLKRCRKKFSEKAVHDLRVEMRRSLALLDFLEAAHFEDSPGETRKILKQRLDAFDELRDTQVQLDLLRPMECEFPEARPLKKLLKRCERRLISKARRKIKKAGDGGLSQRLKSLEKKLAAKTATHTAKDNPALTALGNCFKRAVTLRRKIRKNNPAAIHEMRVAFKRFRYMSELLQPLLPWLTPERLRRMRKYQGLAGDIQDLEVLLARLKCFVAEEELSASAIKRLRMELQMRKKRALDFFMKRIDELFEFQPDDPVKKARA